MDWIRLALIALLVVIMCSAGANWFGYLFGIFKAARDQTYVEEMAKFFKSNGMIKEKEDSQKN